MCLLAAKSKDTHWSTEKDEAKILIFALPRKSLAFT
jgi:hypothetical protein